MAGPKSSFEGKNWDEIKRILVWENGDFQGNGRVLTINSKIYKSWYGILELISHVLKPSFGPVKHLIDLETKGRVRSFVGLRQNGKYIACGYESLRVAKNSYKTVEEQQSVCEPPTFVVPRVEVRNNSSPSCFPRSKETKQKIIIFILCNGNPREMPCKVFLSESDFHSWSLILRLISINLDFPEGIQNLYNVSGDPIIDPRLLKNGEIYVAVAKNEVFVDIDYVELFRQLLPMREVDLRRIEVPHQIRDPVLQKIYKEPKCKKISKSKSDDLPTLGSGYDYTMKISSRNISNANRQLKAPRLFGEKIQISPVQKKYMENLLDKSIESDIEYSEEPTEKWIHKDSNERKTRRYNVELDEVQISQKYYESLVEDGQDKKNPSSSSQNVETQKNSLLKKVDNPFEENKLECVKVYFPNKNLPSVGQKKIAEPIRLSENITRYLSIQEMENDLIDEDKPVDLSLKNKSRSRAEMLPKLMNVIDVFNVVLPSKLKSKAGESIIYKDSNAISKSRRNCTEVSCQNDQVVEDFAANCEFNRVNNAVVQTARKKCQDIDTITSADNISSKKTQSQKDVQNQNYCVPSDCPFGGEKRRFTCKSTVDQKEEPSCQTYCKIHNYPMVDTTPEEQRRFLQNNKVPSKMPCFQAKKEDISLDPDKCKIFKSKQLVLDQSQFFMKHVDQSKTVAVSMSRYQYDPDDELEHTDSQISNINKVLEANSLLLDAGNCSPGDVCEYRRRKTNSTDSLNSQVVDADFTHNVVTKVQDELTEDSLEPSPRQSPTTNEKKPESETEMQENDRRSKVVIVTSYNSEENFDCCRASCYPKYKDGGKYCYSNTCKITKRNEIKDEEPPVKEDSIEARCCTNGRNPTSKGVIAKSCDSERNLKCSKAPNIEHSDDVEKYCYPNDCEFKNNKKESCVGSKGQNKEPAAMEDSIEPSHCASKNERKPKSATEMQENGGRSKVFIVTSYNSEGNLECCKQPQIDEEPYCYPNTCQLKNRKKGMECVDWKTVQPQAKKTVPYQNVKPPVTENHKNKCLKESKEVGHPRAMSTPLICKENYDKAEKKYHSEQRCTVKDGNKAKEKEVNDSKSTARPKKSSWTSWFGGAKKTRQAKSMPAVPAGSCNNVENKIQAFCSEDTVKDGKLENKSCSGKQAKEKTPSKKEIISMQSKCQQESLVKKEAYCYEDTCPLIDKKNEKQKDQGSTNPCRGRIIQSQPQLCTNREEIEVPKRKPSILKVQEKCHMNRVVARSACVNTAAIPAEPNGVQVDQKTDLVNECYRDTLKKNSCRAKESPVQSTNCHRDLYEDLLDETPSRPKPCNNNAKEVVQTASGFIEDIIRSSKVIIEKSSLKPRKPLQGQNKLSCPDHTNATSKKCCTCPSHLVESSTSLRKTPEEYQKSFARIYDTRQSYVDDPENKPVELLGTKETRDVAQQYPCVTTVEFQSSHNLIEFEKQDPDAPAILKCYCKEADCKCRFDCQGRRRKNT